MFMVNRCSQSAYIFFVVSMGHTSYCQTGISICRIQNNRIKHSTWTSIIIAAKYLKHLADNCSRKTVSIKLFFIVQNWNAVDLLKILAICYQIWQSMHTILMQPWEIVKWNVFAKSFKHPKYDHISYYYQLSDHLWSLYLKIYIYSIYITENRKI